MAQEGSWEAPHPDTSAHGNNGAPDSVGRKGLEWELEGSKDTTGTRTLTHQCWVCHHQCLLLFPAHFLTDSKVKSKT